MKKRKIKTGRLLFNERELLRILNEQLRDGYVIDEFNTYYLYFKQTEKTNIKYTIGYQINKSELEGYCIQASFENIFILISDYYQEELHISKEIKDEVLEKLYKPKVHNIIIALCVLAGIVCSFKMDDLSSIIYHSTWNHFFIIALLMCFAYLSNKAHSYLIYQDRNALFAYIINRICLLLSGFLGIVFLIVCLISNLVYLKGVGIVVALGGVIFSFLSKHKDMSTMKKFLIASFACVLMMVPSHEWTKVEPIQKYKYDVSFDGRMTLFYSEKSFIDMNQEEYVGESLYNVYFQSCVKPLVDAILKENDMPYQKYKHEGIDYGYSYKDNYILIKDRKVFEFKDNHTKNIDTIIERMSE